MRGIHRHHSSIPLNLYKPLLLPLPPSQITSSSSTAMSTRVDPSPTSSPLTDLELLLDKQEVFTLHGRDKHGRRILLIVGKFYPACYLSGTAGEAALKSYVEKRIIPAISGGPFCIVYVHSCVQRSENFPGLSVLRSLYEALPATVRGGLEAVYFVHPGLQARVFLAMCGRFLFSSGLYGKVRYVSRLEFLGEYVRRGEVEVPEFVEDHDEALERRPLMDYGLETDNQRMYDAPAMDSAASMYSLRCIS